jgi:hypothetical protein
MTRLAAAGRNRLVGRRFKPVSVRARVKSSFKALIRQFLDRKIERCATVGVKPLYLISELLRFSAGSLGQ